MFIQSLRRRLAELEARMGMHDDDEQKTVLRVVFVGADGTETDGPTIVIPHARAINDRV
jgi:hypothetical protein